MYFKEVEDDKRDKETEEFVKSEVDKLNGAEVEFWKILRKTKTDMVTHLEERKTTVSNKLKEFVEGDPIHGALLKRQKELDARIGELCEISPAQEPPKKRRKRFEMVPSFHSFEKTRKECKDFVIFARSPPEFKRESRMVDAFDFEAGKHSAICAKLDCDSVKRIHDDIVVGIKKATWDKLKKKYRSGEEAL